MVLNKLGKLRLFFQKYSRREFRPGYVFDVPQYLYRLYICVKAKSFVFFSNVNPWMFLSWFAGYGKHAELDKFDRELSPKTILIFPKENFWKMTKKIKNVWINYPFIVKPDFGRTGRDVKKIHNEKELRNYYNKINENFVIQEFLHHPLEFGVFYYRIPGEKRWHITGIVEKRFMFLRGDGKSTFEKLILHHSRAKYYYSKLQQEYYNLRDSVLADGEEFQLNYIGNHCRWSTFYDKSNLINEQLERVFDRISKKIGWFYFGRYDIKVKSLEDLYKWNIKIIELNGMWSLPVHIYDPDHGLWFAYKELFRHWEIAYKISRKNLERWIPYMSVREVQKVLRKYGV